MEGGNGRTQMAATAPTRTEAQGGNVVSSSLDDFTPAVPTSVSFKDRIKSFQFSVSSLVSLIEIRPGQTLCNKWLSCYVVTVYHLKNGQGGW